jgi:hypothetical protein
MLRGQERAWRNAGKPMSLFPALICLGCLAAGA